MDAFNTEKPYEVFPEDDPTNKRKLLKVRCIKQFPALTNVITGECLYNLRSALDQLMYAATTRNGIEMMKRSGFYIERTRDEFEGALRDTAIEKRLPAVAALLRELQPYKGGNNVLWRLHKLNVLDKHRVIVPIMAVHKVVDYKFVVKVNRGGQLVVLTDYQWMDENSGIVMTHPDSIQIESGGYVDVAVSVGFRDVDSPVAEPVVDALQQFTDAVSGIARIFEDRFFNK